eukprot:gene13355-28303_t
MPFLPGTASENAVRLVLDRLSQSAAALVSSGNVRVLAVTSEKRLPAFPDVPALSEIAPKVQAVSWVGISAPAQTPAAITLLLEKEILAILQSPEMRNRLSEPALGMTLTPMGSDRDQGSQHFTQLVTRCQQVSRFDQDQTPLDTEGLVLAQVGTANPASLTVASMLIGKDTFDDEYLLAAEMSVGVEIGTWRPPHHRGVFRLKFRQRHDGQAFDHSAVPLCQCGINHNPIGVRRIKMPQLDEQGTSALRKWRMAGARRVLQVSARPVTAKVVTQGPIKHQNFFSKFVQMGVKPRAGIVANDGSGPCDFAAITFQQSAVNLR